jgi:hypothetical protein
MGKRQFRIPGKNILSNNAVLLGKEVNLLMKNNIVFHGVITGWDEKSILIKDMRLNKHTFPLSHIEEIIIDHTSLY